MSEQSRKRIQKKEAKEKRPSRLSRGQKWLLVLVAVLYIVGKALKASQDVKDKHIPLILGGAGVFLAMLWVVATGSFDGVQSIALGLFTGIVQGVLVAGCSVYANQLVKQAGRAD